MLLQNPAPTGDGVAPAAVAGERDGVIVRGVRVSHGGAPLFDDLDVAFPARRTTCILGVSGVGKSTLLRLIAGLPPVPERGSAGDEAGLPLDGRLAYMAQDDLLLPWASVWRNVTLGSRLRGEPIDHDRAAALIGAVGLADCAEALPHTLSGGMRHRTALARTLMEERPIVLMDEPFSALDALTRHQLQDLVAELFGGRTIILVTHDPIEALRLGHAVHVMANRPAQLDEPLIVPGDPPRDPTSPEIVALQRELMAKLGLGRATRATNAPAWAASG